MTQQWQEIRDRTRLWCKIDPRRCLIEIVHRGARKFIDLRAYGLIYVGAAALEREDIEDPASPSKLSRLAPDTTNGS